MSGSGEFMLFLNQTGQVAGFGNNDYSQLPGATGQQQPITSTALNPVSISSSGSNSSNIIQICATGAGYTNGKGAACALFGNGSVSCWGDNTFGQLGQGTTGTTPTATPTPVSAITNAVALFGTGSYYNGGFCALLATGSYVCWGSMYDGFNTPTLTPISGLP
jgi:alpha-tubulin suppressor-like RCC1 family protein